MNECIYVLGGTEGLEDAVGSKTAEMYDPKTGRWTYITPMLDGRSMFDAGVVYGEIYAVGGFQYNVPTNS